MFAKLFRKLAMIRMNGFARRGRALRFRRRALESMFRLEDRVTPTVTLGLGDMAITGYASDTTDKISLVILRDVDAGTQFTVTDEGWLATQAAFRGTTEGETTFQFNSNLPAGTQISLDFTTPAYSNGITAVAGGADRPSLSTGGDSILIYNGGFANRPTSGTSANWITGMNMNGSSAWDADATSDNTSARPTIFDTNTSFAGFTPEVDNAVLNNFGALTGTPASIRTFIYTASNWTVNNTTPPTIPGTTTFAFLSSATVTLSGANNLVVTGNASFPNNLTIRVTGTNYQISESSGAFRISTSIAGSSGNGTNSVLVPIALVSGTQIQVNAGDANDSLTVDFSGPTAFSDAIVYDGGAQPTGDTIRLIGGTFPSVTHNLTGPTAGNFIAGSNATISYANAESADITGLTVANLQFNLPTAGTNNALLASGGAGVNRLSSTNSTFAPVDFANPTNSLTVARGTAGDTMTVNALPDFNRTLTIGSPGTTFNSIVFGGTVTLGSGANLSAHALNTIDFPATTSDIATSGAGSVLLTTVRNINLASGSSITTVDGNISLSANTAATMTGAFVGLQLTSAEVRTTGAGSISATAVGGTGTLGGQHGIQLTGAGAAFTATGSGSITLDGRGRGMGTGTDNDGIRMNAGAITSGTSGNVSITGRAGLNADSEGIHLAGGSIVTSSSSGQLSLISNTFSISNTATITATGRVVNLRQLTNNTALNVGTSATTTWGLSDAQLDRITGGTLNIGDVNSGEITVSAAISHPNNLSLTSGAGITVSNPSGTVTMAANRNLTVSAAGTVNLSTTSADLVASGTGTISLTGGAITLASGSSVTTAATGGITYVADSMTLTGATSAGTGTVALRPRTATTQQINLGGADGAGVLGLTDVELDTITAGTLAIGSGTSGALTVTANITRSANTAVQLVSGGDIAIVGGQVQTGPAGGGTLLLDPGVTPAAVRPTKSGVDATATTVTFGGDLLIPIVGTVVDSGYTQLNVAGTVNLTGATLKLTGGFVPAVGNVFTIVSATSRTGTFAGTSDGGTIAFNGVVLTVNYTATTVTLTRFAVNNSPVVTAGGTLNYVQGQSATAIDTTVTVIDTDSANLTGATVQLTTNYVNGQDILGFTTQNGISGGFNAATGTLTLTGPSSVANYQTALRSVTYFNNSSDPSSANRTVVWRVNDGTSNSNTATSTITVTPANRAPTLAVPGNAFTTITEDQTAPAGDSVSTLIANRVSDLDVGALSGIAVTAISGFGGGVWSYSTNAGTTWTNVGAVANNAALLLRSEDLLRFVPDQLNGGLATVTFRAWDQTSGAFGTIVDPGPGGGSSAFSTNAGISNLTVRSVNDAPTLTAPGNAFPTITEDNPTPTGAPVSALIAGRVADVDLGPAFGIAVVATSTTSSGSWQFSIDGGTTWTNVGAVSGASALLLRSQDLLRFVPDGSHGGTASVLYRAWDQTTGLFGLTADTGAGGGTSAFSATMASSSITVTEVPEAKITSLVIGDGTAQRSRVDRIVVTFSEAINTATLGASAFSLMRTGPTGSPQAINVNVAWSAGNTVATLTFSGPGVEVDNSPGATGGSLVDGNYRLMVNGSQILTSTGNQPIDADNDDLQGGTRTENFFRLFGDINGDRQVDNVDFFPFRTALGSTLGSPNYRAAFDFNGDGQLDNTDYLQFQLRLGRPPLPPSP